MDAPAKKAGRPAKHGAAQSPAARQWAYRQRQKKAEGEATEKPQTASTAALLACLKYHFKNMDSETEHADIARRLATPVLRELCARYKIQLT
jgi:hypothetical protein